MCTVRGATSRISVLGVLLAAGCAAAWAQNGGDQNPPAFTNILLSTTPCSAPTPWDLSHTCIEELDLLFVCATVFDRDWIQDPNNTSQSGNQKEGVAITMQSFWDQFIFQGLAYGPEPPPVVTDRAGAFDLDFYFVPPPTTGSSLLVQLVFLVPKFSGPNQARLRGLIDYDVLWDVQLRVWNAGATDTSIDTTKPSAGAFFFVCGISNPRLAQGNPPPNAEAGVDQTVAISPQTGQVTVTLDAERTFDGSNIGFSPLSTNVIDRDTLQFTWEWISGPVRVDPVEDNDGNPATSQVTFDVPTTPDNPYVYRLLVEDGVNAIPSADLTHIFVRATPLINRAPHAVIVGPTAAVAVGGTIRLDGSTSTDPDGDQLTYQWQQTNEVGDPLAADQVLTGFQPASGVNSAVSTWQAITTGRFFFRLLVTDQPQLRDAVLAGQQLTSATMVAVDVTATATAGAQSSAQSDNGSGAPALPFAPCGSGMLPVAVVPLALLMLRGRWR
jgi:hypothetical protein